LIKSTPKYIPKASKIKSWEFSRRNFIKGSLALAALSQLQLLASCTDGFVENTILNKEQYQLLLSVQNILFPKDTIGPSAKEINAHLYFIWTLSDENILKSDKKYALDGIKWIQETAQEAYQTNYLKLSNEQQEELIKKVSNKNWGENWLSYMMTFIIEAMVSDPIYGFNKNAIGVKWLAHQYGLPRPNATTKYPEIFKTIAKNEE